ncbi:type II secretion system F family protein [Desulfitibacter alkalitolerans]|uniref:type II secretion system F family protein n=1 Tax=Desulfitibacter alkalitolerans TaxID=264641 RepID=UPI000A022C43|nr:type II secretion system F family protein [Desulfitibacter alkalitolerans]
MTIYNYRVMDHKGQYQEGTIEAEDIKSAANRLREQGLYVVKLDTNRRSLDLIDYFSSVKSIDLASLNQQLGVLVNAGIPLVSALEVVEKQTDNPKMQKAITSVKASLREGKTFYHSLKQHSNIFDSMMLNMVQAGELGGVLGNILFRLSEHYEREHEVKEKVKAAMTYPVLVLVMSVAAVIFMIIFILPVFAGMLGEMSNALPIPTKILISFSGILLNYWHLNLLILFSMSVSFILYSRSLTGRALVDKIRIGFPLLGDLHKKIIVARFCRTLGILLGAGVPILHALEVTSQTTDNSIFMQALTRCRDVVMDGKSMVKPLLDSGIFPYMVAHMAKVGEETGKLDVLLIQVGDYFQREVDRKMDNLSKLIEPAMIIIVGGLVGFLVLSMVLPMFTIISSF